MHDICAYVLKFYNTATTFVVWHQTPLVLNGNHTSIGITAYVTIA